MAIMKLNVVDTGYNLRPQEVYKNRGTEQVSNNFLRDNSSIYPKDKVDITGIAKHIMQSVNGRQVELTYSLYKQKVSAEIINEDGEKIAVRNENLPNELKEISSPEIFSAFLKNTYAKVSVLSDGEYRLYINHRMLGGGKDDPEGSMTPRTQGRKEFNITSKVKYTDEFCKQNFEKLSKEKEVITKIIEPTTFVQKCIEETEKALEAFKNGIIFEQVYQQNIRKKDLTNFVSDLVDNKPVVIRYGINPSALGVVVGQPLDKKVLHPIEESLLQLAGEYLNKAPHAELVLSKESKLYPNNVVLVDIFVREDGKIKQDESSNKPETHTIVLWRKKELEILLIDPSRVDFSKELIGSIKSFLKVEVKLHNPTGGVIYGTGGKETGYSELKSTTIAEHKHRDCVDIATKIGFEINELQIDENVLSLEQIERAINLQISNQKQVATYLTNTSHGQPNRASQSTDVNVRRDNRQVLELMK